MDAERVLILVEGACAEAGSRWAVIGGVAMNAYGYARTTFDLDIAAEEASREVLLQALAGRGFRSLNEVEGFTNLLHSDPALGRLDVMWLDRVTADRVFARTLRLPGVGGVDVSVPA